MLYLVVQIKSATNSWVTNEKRELEKEVQCLAPLVLPTAVQSQCEVDVNVELHFWKVTEMTGHRIRITYRICPV